MVNTFANETNDPKVDSVEGIMYTLNDGVIMSGEFVDDYEVNGEKSLKGNNA